eukprot:Polyplicarium_translucidae@DN1979_c0_g1_i1.p2
MKNLGLLVDGTGTKLVPLGRVVGAESSPTAAKLNAVLASEPDVIMWLASPSVKDEVVSAQLTLSSQTAPKKERIVFDVQISCGYMHSGYPIMAQLDVVTAKKDKLPHVVDEAALRQGSWGLWHELGHNRQKTAWTFGGTSEVTVNIFTAFAFQQIVGTEPYKLNSFENNAMRKGIAYLRDTDPRSFQGTWKRECWVAFSMYVYLMQNFGWPMFEEVFRQYEALPPNTGPKTDSEKMCLWVVMTSKAARRDLRPFYKQWKFPFEQLQGDQVAALSSLPAWKGDVLKEFESVEAQIKK